MLADIRIRERTPARNVVRVVAYGYAAFVTDLLARYGGQGVVVILDHASIRKSRALLFTNNKVLPRVWHKSFIFDCPKLLVWK